MIIGTSMALETCLILGQVSHNSLCSKKKLLTETCGPGREKRGNSSHPGQIIYGQSCGNQWAIVFQATCTCASWHVVQSMWWCYHFSLVRKHGGERDAVMARTLSLSDWSEHHGSLPQPHHQQLSSALDTKQKHGKHGSGVPLSSFPLLLVVVFVEQNTANTNWSFSKFNFFSELFFFSQNFHFFTIFSRYHVELRVKLHSSRKESFPIPQKYFDASRTARTHLDVKQERRIDGSRDLSGSWTGFTQLTPLEEKPPDWFLLSGGRLTKQQVTSRRDPLWPRALDKIGRKCQTEGETKMVQWKNETRQCQKIARNLFHFSLRTRNSMRPSKRLAIGNADVSFYALRDKQIMSAWSYPWQTNGIKSIKTCVYFGSQWIHKTAHGRISSELSWGSHCGKGGRFTATFEFGTQICSHASNSRSKGSNGSRLGELEKIPAWDITKNQK